MANTVISPLIYSPYEYNIAVMLDSKSVENVTKIQNELLFKLGDAIWVTPSNCLHITLMEIICDVEYRDLSRKQAFENWYIQYNQITKELLSSIYSFKVIFNKLQVSDRAIIIKAENPQSFNGIRKTLLSEISLPVDTKLPPDIVHCSIARYNKSIELDEVYKAVEDIEVNIEESVSNFRLMKDLVPPDFNPNLVEEYKLAS